MSALLQLASCAEFTETTPSSRNSTNWRSTAQSGGASLEGGSLQRVAGPLGVFLGEERGGGWGASTAAAGVSGAGTAGAAEGGADRAAGLPSVPWGVVGSAGLMFSLSFTSPASFNPRSLHFLP